MGMEMRMTQRMVMACTECGYSLTDSEDYADNKKIDDNLMGASNLTEADLRIRLVQCSKCGRHYHKTTRPGQYRLKKGISLAALRRHVERVLLGLDGRSYDDFSIVEATLFS